MESVMGSPAPGARPRKEGDDLSSAMGGDAPSPELQSLLQAVSADPRPHELGGFDRPLASYRAAIPQSRPSARRSRRPFMLSSLLGAKLGATIAGVAVGLGGVVVATYTASTPGGARNVDHTTIGASVGTATSTPKPTTTKTPVGPDATGPAAFGLCNAWTHHQANGAKPTNSVAFRNLATAAGGESKIAAYCATIPHPGNTNHPTGKSTAKPTKQGKGNTAKPSGKPSSPVKPTKVPKVANTTEGAHR